MTHPENSEELNAIIEMAEGASMIKVFCRGCNAPREMNSVYAKWAGNGIDSCRFCRDKVIRERNIRSLGKAFDLSFNDGQT